MVATSSTAKRPLKAQVLLALLGLILAAVALVAESVGGCRACGPGDGTRLAIAIGGTAGYLGLAAVGLGGFGAAFHAGVIAAAAVHTALATWMATVGTLCPLCVAIALAAFGNAALGLALGHTPAMLLERIYVPTLLVTSGLVFVAIAKDGTALAERHAAAQVALSEPHRGRPATGATIRVLVYENDHCGHCRDFRDAYAPQLAKEFESRVAVEYRDAATAPWVRRTPTIAVEGGPVFEGLPIRYEDLRGAVEAALASAEGGSR